MDDANDIGTNKCKENQFSAAMSSLSVSTKAGHNPVWKKQ